MNLSEDVTRAGTTTVKSLASMYLLKDNGELRDCVKWVTSVHLHTVSMKLVSTLDAIKREIVITSKTGIATLGLVVRIFTVEMTLLRLPGVGE